MYNLELPLSTIARNNLGTDQQNHPDSNKNSLFSVGGQKHLKLVKLNDNNEFKVHKVLKTTRTSNKNGTTDLAWSNFHPNILASTTLVQTFVLVWDVNQISLDKQFHKVGTHTQMINRVSFSHHDPNSLASCSQDGFLNIWDTRQILNEKDPENQKISMYHKDKIRDCQFSPYNEHWIMSSYISGSVKLWDLRKYDKAVNEFIGHDTDTLTIDWHPELKNIFASGAMDKNLFVWDINITENNKPIISYKSSHGISRLKWWKKNPQYIVSSYQTNNFYVSMWNVNIDNMPEYTFKGHKDVVTGFCFDSTGYLKLKNY